MVKAAMQAATPATANNLENQPHIEFPLRTNGPRLSRAKPLHAIVGIPLPTVQWIKVDRNAAVLFDGQMTVLALICAKTLSFIVYSARCQIDFGHFDPMFALNAALDRTAIPQG
jgi:hypothetical protein